LALAAAATALGFSSFVPTAYRGLAELGEVAGCGMIIAFATSITILPALLMVLNPPGEPNPMGFSGLAPVDEFIRRYRIPVVVTTLVVVMLASPLLLFLPFDFNPLHLRNPKVESVATFLDLRKDPRTGANAIEIIAPTLDAADGIAKRLRSLPKVSQVNTLSQLVPAEQDQKLSLIQNAAEEIKTALTPTEVFPPPTDQQNIEALRLTASNLSAVAGNGAGPGAGAARRLSGLLVQLAKADPAAREAVERAVIEPLRFSPTDCGRSSTLSRSHPKRSRPISKEIG
jgi:predicted RND superfamily exporter protein